MRQNEAEGREYFFISKRGFSKQSNEWIFYRNKTYFTTVENKEAYGIMVSANNKLIKEISLVL